MGYKKRESWSSRVSFVLAAAGSAIGLGNIWKFPYMAGESGGGAFVLVYLACIAVIAIPIFMAELFIGQKSQSSVLNAFNKVEGKNSPWQLCGWMGFTSVIILSFYSVVGGWVLDFEFKSLMGSFSGLSTTEIEGLLSDLLASSTRQIFWHAIFMGIVTFIVYKGVKKGLEKWNKILMPTLMGLLLLLLFKALTLDGFGQTMTFLFVPHWEQLTWTSVLSAIGHSFFTLSLGMGAIMTYGSYLSTKETLPKLAITISILDTLIAIIAGIVIFSVVFSFGLEPGAGPSLIFSTLPSLFIQMTGGGLLSIAFFLLVAFAAITSAVSLLEVPVAALNEKYHISRQKATLMTSAVVFLTGILCALSFNHLSEFKIFGLTFFDFFDTTSNWLLPLGGLVIALFIGWRASASKELLEQITPRYYARDVFLWILRIVAPISIILIILGKFFSWI